MTFLQLLGFSSVCVLIFGHLFLILKRLSSIEKFISTNPKFVYQAEIVKKDDGSNKIIATLPFTDFHKAEKINSLTELFQKRTDLSLIKNSSILPEFIFPVDDNLNTILERSESMFNIFSSLANYVNNNGRFKSKNKILDFIFNNSNYEKLHITDIANIFIFHKRLFPDHLSEHDIIMDHNINNPIFMRRICSLVHNYVNKFTKFNIKKIGKSTWQLHK